MDRDSAEMRASYPQLFKVGFFIMTKIMVALVLLAFIHNLFAVDIHINQARHEFEVKLIVNEMQHVRVEKLLKLAAHYLLPQGLFSI